MNEKITLLKSILKNSRYTVAVCGAGLMEEGGFLAVKHQNRAYDIEQRYGYGPEELFTSACYNTRPELFFQFYKKEMLENPPKVTASGAALAAMEEANLLHCIITSNIYNFPRQCGCKHVINLHGVISENRCPRCHRDYSLDYVMNSPHIVPLCETCKVPVRPLVSLFGEMVDSQKMTETTEEIAKADTLLLLGTRLDSEVYTPYLQYFNGRSLVIIHSEPHYLDHRADLVIIDHPKNVLPQLIQ